MTDQMTPDKLRAAAERHHHCRSSERDVDVLIDAARRLADVIEYVGKQMGPPASEWEHDPVTILQAIDSLTRGETDD